MHSACKRSVCARIHSMNTQKNILPNKRQKSKSTQGVTSHKNKPARQSQASQKRRHATNSATRSAKNTGSHKHETNKKRRSAANSHSKREGLYCPIDRKCGGCEFLRVAYTDQLKHKQYEIMELFSGLIDVDTTVDYICGMDDPRYYRNKVVSPFVQIYDKKAHEHRILCGMYERGTHWVIDSDSCLIENQIAKDIILSVRNLMPQFGLSAYDENTNTGFLRHAMVRVGHNSGEVMLTLVTRTDKFPSSKHFVRELKKRHPELTTVVQNINSRKTNVILGDKEKILYGPGFILDTLCGLSFRISSQSFYQVNATQTEVLYTRAIEMAHLTGTETVIDAYCGTGTIGLVAAHGVSGCPGAKRVIGIEERNDAVVDACNNARHNGITDAEFIAGDAGVFMRERAQGISADVLLMDPPRSGATPDFLKAAVEMGPRRIVYISCGPKTQFRDVAYCLKHGYRIEEIQPVDMFPHTDHIENIVALVRIDN